MRSIASIFYVIVLLLSVALIALGFMWSTSGSLLLTNHDRIPVFCSRLLGEKDLGVIEKWEEQGIGSICSQ